MDRASTGVSIDLGADELMARVVSLRNEGNLLEALDAAEKATVLMRSVTHSDAQRAAALCQLGATQLKLAHLGEAVANLSLALDLAEKPPPDFSLAAAILEWRSRCYQVQRDFAAAALDCDRGIRYAQGCGDRHQLAHLYFQAALVAERSGDPGLARMNAEWALGLFEEVGDTLSTARTLNNLGAFVELLGDHDGARKLIERAFSQHDSGGYPAEAGQALSSLAQVELNSGHPALAVRTAERALALLDGRDDFVDETGSTLLVEGRALTELSRFRDAEAVLQRAETLFRRVCSVGHQSAAWMALGDLSVRRNDYLRAVSYFRHAAAAMQDVHF